MLLKTIFLFKMDKTNQYSKYYKHFVSSNLKCQNEW